MKMNTKGFTLIELLAVIIILAIIALIATPVVLNLLKEARISAAKDSTYGIVKAAEYYYAQQLLTATPVTANKDFNSPYNELNFKGTAPTSGTVTLKADGSVEIVSDTKLMFGTISCTYDGTTASCTQP